MHHPARRLFPYFVILVGLASLAWAVTFGTLPKADFALTTATKSRPSIRRKRKARLNTAFSRRFTKDFFGKCRPPRSRAQTG